MIEHVNDPVGLLQAAAEALAPDAIVLLVTPDIASTAARLLGARWWHLRLAHVGYFNDRSMAVAAQRAGLRIARRQRALWYFPIGYLAQRMERYLPLSRLNRLVLQSPWMRRTYEWTIPLNLFDSSVFLLVRSAESQR